jgi:hypothetical protein
MPNNSHTSERSPSQTKSNLPKKSRLLVYSWLPIVVGGVLSLAIASLAIISLTNTGRIAKDPSKQTTIASQKVATQGNRWLTVVLLGAGVATSVVVFKLRPNLPIIFQNRRSRRQQRRLLLKQNTGIATEITPEIEPLIETPSVQPSSPTVTVLPPEQDRTGEPSLAEMMDIRKHLSLTEILQDFKRPN